MPILDNFDSQFINNASELENGLMSSYDKTKLDSINLKDIDYISDELDNIEEFLKPRYIYGIKIDTTNPDINDCVTYTDDAVTFTPLKVDQSTGVCNYGSWKTIIDTLLGVTPCLINNNGELLFKLNPNDYTKTEDGKSIDIESGEFGQVMIRFNHVYYKFSMEDRYIKFQISNKKVDTTWIDTAFLSEDGIGSTKDYMYISAYEVSQINNKLQSVSNALPSLKLPYDEIEKLTEFGVFHMMNIVRKQFVIFLSYLITKSIDLKRNIGIGNIDGETLKTGTMNDKGLFYGKISDIGWIKSNAISTCGIKCVYNANGIWVAGCTNNGNGSISSKGLYYSIDGIEWIQSNITSGIFWCVYYANGIWVTGSDNGLYYSIDGKTWTQSNITNDDFLCVYNANGIWVAGSYSGNGLYYSIDGKEWTKSNITRNGFDCVYYANGLWVAGSSAYGKGLYYSIDGKTWTQSNITNISFMCVYYANGIWVTGSNGNKGLYYSLDGKIWTLSNITNISFSSIYNSNGIWVAGSNHVSDNGLYYSIDGKTWTQSNITSGYFDCIYYANSIWVACGYSRLYYSIDGKTWTQSNITSGYFSCVYNANGIWVAGSGGGLLYGKNNNTEGVKLFGIENLWGNQLKYMHGIIQKLMHVINKETGMMDDEQHIFIKEFYPYDKISDFTDCGKIDPNLYGYISSIKFLSKSIYFPDKLDGSSISYYKSYFQNGESTDSKQELYGIYGGNKEYGNKCGQEFLLLGYINPENTSATTHLIF